MKTILLIFFLAMPFYISAQIFQYTSEDVLNSKRNKITGQTIYSKPVKGNAIFKLDAEYKRATLFFTADNTSMAFTDLSLKSHPGIQLYKGVYKGLKLTIMIAEGDRTVSVITEENSIQEGFVLQQCKKVEKKTFLGKE